MPTIKFNERLVVWASAGTVYRTVGMFLRTMVGFANTSNEETFACPRLRETQRQIQKLYGFEFQNERLIEWRKNVETNEEAIQD